MSDHDIALADLLAIPDARLLRGQIQWRDLADHLDALGATGEAPDAGCGDCELKCCSYVVRVLDSEMAPLLECTQGLGLTEGEAFLDKTPLEVCGHRTLARRLTDRACVFMAEGHRCRIHAAYGLERKPMVCQLYPGQPTLTPTGARIAVRAECTRPARTRDPETVQAYHRLLRRRAEHEPGMGVQQAPDNVLISGDVVVPWSAYAAWEAEAAAAIRQADTAIAGLDQAVEAMLARWSAPRPPLDPIRVRVLAGSLSGVFESMDACAEAEGLVAVATEAPPVDARPASRALIAHAVESLEPLRFASALAGLGVLRLVVAVIDRVPAAAEQPREQTARLFRKLHIDRIRLPIARSQPATLEALAIDPLL